MFVIFFKYVSFRISIQSIKLLVLLWKINNSSARGLGNKTYPKVSQCALMQYQNLLLHPEADTVGYDNALNHEYDN